MNAGELRRKSVDELQVMEQELRKELFQLRMQHYTGQLDRPSRIRETRKDIARVLTVIRDREGGEQ